MNTQELLDAITRLPQRRSDVPTPPPIELVALMVRWNRSLHQWKASTLADFAKVSVSSVERIERGEKVTDEVLDKIAQAFGYNTGHFTKPRIPLSEDEAMSSLVDTCGHLEAVRVFPMKTHRAVRDAAKCDAILIHRPEVPETYDTDIENLKEWFDLASFVLSDFVDEPSTSERGRRDLYNDIRRVPDSARKIIGEDAGLNCHCQDVMGKASSSRVCANFLSWMSRGYSSAVTDLKTNQMIFKQAVEPTVP